jgi:hypothetical protein
MDTAEFMFDQSGQLIGSAINGLVDGRRMMRDCDGLPIFEAGFHHTAHVVFATLIAVLVNQVHFHSRNVITESAEGISH